MPSSEAFGDTVQTDWFGLDFMHCVGRTAVSEWHFQLQTRAQEGSLLTLAYSLLTPSLLKPFTDLYLLLLAQIPAP